MKLVFRVIIALAGSYALGGLLGGELVAKLNGIDLRRHGSGNVGTTNVLRTLGPISAIGTLLVDVAKGIAAVLLGRWTGIPGIDAVCGFLAVAGHSWPFFARKRGGKGIATGCGTIIMLAPQVLLVLVPLWAALALPTGYVSLGSVAAAVAFPFIMFLFKYREAQAVFLVIYAVVCSAIVLYRHKENIGRLLQGSKNNLWRRKKKELA